MQSDRRTEKGNRATEEGGKMSKEKIIKTIYSFNGKYNTFTIFQDFVRMYAISIRSAMQKDPEQEKEYESIRAKYTDNEFSKMCEMGAFLIEALESNIEDILGQVYMELSISNKVTGQFFTPSHVSNAMAQMIYDSSAKEQLEAGKKVIMNEPTCGSGANILALAKIMLEAGYNPQTKLKVTANDLDQNCVDMTYIQLSLLGIPAKVTHGDGLTGNIFKTYYTFAWWTN